MFTKNWVNSDSFTKNSAGKPKRREGATKVETIIYMYEYVCVYVCLYVCKNLVLTSFCS